ncbi:hypothetical protein EJ110_NYTH23569 [Nymphaea thermarum]|nr:hypothetical protein EJ110_NYTH23569 [Nymphaea thermarum]
MSIGNSPVGEISRVLSQCNPLSPFAICCLAEIGFTGVDRTQPSASKFHHNQKTRLNRMFGFPQRKCLAQKCSTSSTTITTKQKKPEANSTTRVVLQKSYHGVRKRP